MTKLDPTKALLETADFAAGILQEINNSRRLGVDTLAGKAIEAQTRLQAASALVRENDKDLIAQETRVRVLRSLGLGDDVKFSPHSAYAVGHVELQAGTLAEGLALIERFNPINAASPEACKFSPRPNPEDAPQYWKPHKSQTYVDTVHGNYFPYWGTVSSGLHFEAEFQFHCYVKISDGGIVEIRAKVANAEPIRRTARRVNYVGGYRYDDVTLSGWRETGYFTRVGKMWSSPEYVNDFVVLP